MPDIDVSKSFFVGEWLVSPDNKEIQSGTTIVKVDPRNMRVLQVLAARPGTVVSQSDIEGLAWAGLVVTPNSLYQSIAQLRRAFGESKLGQRYIETVSRRGYRLLAQVRSESLPVVKDTQTSQSEISVGSTQLSAGSMYRFARSRSVEGLAIAAAAAICFAIWFFVWEHDEAPAIVVKGAVVREDSDKPYWQSIQHLEKRLAAETEKAGTGTLQLVPYLVELSDLYPLVSDPQSGERVSRRGLDILAAHGRELSADAISLHMNLAEALADSEQYREAEQHLQKVFQIEKQIGNQDDFATVAAIRQLALLRTAEGRFDEAVTEARRAIAAYANVDTRSKTGLAHFKSTLAWALMRAGRTDDAVKISADAIDSIDPNESGARGLAAIVYSIRGEALIQDKKYSEAESALRKSLDLFTQFPSAHMDIERAKVALADALLHRGNLTEATQLLDAAQPKLQLGDGWREREARHYADVVRQNLQAATS